MKLHHLRNATLILELENHRLLVDPMLGPKGSIPPFTFLRFPPKRNPLVALPPHSGELLATVTDCLITHSRALGIRALQHFDHLDQHGEQLLRTRSIPVCCPHKDAAYLRKLGLNVTTALSYGERQTYLGGHITAVPATHGYDWVRYIMANGAGYFLQYPGEPSIYISGDTVYSDAVKGALRQFHPDICVVAAGAAQLDVGRPLLMTLDDLLSFAQDAPGKVVANHLEALNHCPVSREQLRKRLREEALEGKVLVPEDGEVLCF